MHITRVHLSVPSERQVHCTRLYMPQYAENRPSMDLTEIVRFVFMSGKEDSCCSPKKQNHQLIYLYSINKWASLRHSGPHVEFMRYTPRPSLPRGMSLNSLITSVLGPGGARGFVSHVQRWAAVNLTNKLQSPEGWVSLGCAASHQMRTEMSSPVPRHAVYGDTIK